MACYAAKVLAFRHAVGARALTGSQMLCTAAAHDYQANKTN